MKKTGKNNLFTFFCFKANQPIGISFLRLSFFLICFLSLISVCCYAEEHTEIISENLEYLESSATYIARGNVRIQRADAIIQADEIQYSEQSSDMVATGSVRYEDQDVLITASKAELNFETKTGKLFDGEIFYKKDNYHISGSLIEKRGEDYYYSPEATFTTCDAPLPAWCFKGKHISALFGDTLKARHVSFFIKNLPVLYTPYFSAPILVERKSGFLFPTVGYSESRGFQFNLPFFWALSENRDITLNLNIYSERGVGEGLEYRYIEPYHAEGKWWFYHQQDTELKKDYFEVRARHEQRSPDTIGGFLNINYINDNDYFREFSNRIEVRTNRFLESSGEISVPFTNSRLYLLSQYWIDLREDDDDPPQRLPELGFVLNPTYINPLWIYLDATASHFWREDDVHGQRVDVYPRFLHSFGETVQMSQMIGLRETAYSLEDSQEENNPHRESFEYRAALHTRIMKTFSAFSHVIEPALGYHYITNNENNLEIFDETELYKEMSLIELSLLNRFLGRKGEFVSVRATQGFDTDQGYRPFRPLKLELAMRKPFSLRLTSDFNIYKGVFETIISDMSFNISEITFSASQSYDRENDITYYKAGIGIHPFKPVYLGMRLWYDEKEQEVQEFSADLKYLRQCWGFDLQYVKRPDDFSLSVLFELRGLMQGLQFMN